LMWFSTAVMAVLERFPTVELSSRLWESARHPLSWPKRFKTLRFWGFLHVFGPFLHRIVRNLSKIDCFMRKQNLPSRPSIAYIQMRNLRGSILSAWFYLTIAIILEIGATLCLKLSNGFTDLRFGVASLILYCACFVFFAPAIKKLPMGVMYAIWCGAGIVGIAAFGYIIFGQTLTPAQMGFIGLILVGAIGLNMTTRES